MRKLKLDELNRPGLEEFRRLEKYPIIVVLDNIRSALNVGSIFRSCDAFAVDSLFLTGITAKPPHKEINKTAIGATESVNWHYQSDILSVVKDLKVDHLIIGVEQTDGSVSLDDFKLPDNFQKIVLVLGNEVEGLSDDIIPLLDQCVEIPQYGTKHSINVAVCAGIVIWDMLSRIKENHN